MTSHPSSTRRSLPDGCTAPLRKSRCRSWTWAAAGVLIAALGSGVRATGAVILINAVSYGAVILSLQRMRQHELHPAKPTERHRGMIADGVRYTLARPDLMLILTIVFFAGTFGLNFQITSALMATEVFHKGASEYGLLGTTLAIGSLSGALLAARRRQIRHRLVILAAVAFGLTEIVAGLLPSYLLFAIWTPVLGVFSLTMITSANATFQMRVAPEMRGRVGEGRADHPGQVEGGGVQADRVGEVVATDDLADERLPRGGVEGRPDPEHEGQHEDVPGLRDAGHREQPEQQRGDRQHQLGHLQQAPLGEAVGDQPGVR